MAFIKVNLDDVNDSNLVDPGWHLVRVLGVEEKESQSSEFPYFTWELEISDPDNEFNGQKFWLNTSLSPKALSMLKRFVKACGVEWTPEGIHTEDVLGSELEVLNKHREYDGEPQNNITNYRAI